MPDIATLRLIEEVRHDSERAALLRESPLPEAIGEILALLGGHPDRLLPAAAQLECEPEDLLESARHYVREVLLHPEADDARMLGITAASGPEDLKLNYRALQSWLHPDREGAPADAGDLSARLNAAWSRLRALMRDSAEAKGLVEFRPRWRKVELPARPVRRWPRYALMAAALGIAGWILLPVAFREPPRGDAEPGTAAVTVTAPPASADTPSARLPPAQTGIDVAGTPASTDAPAVSARAPGDATAVAVAGVIRPEPAVARIAETTAKPAIVRTHPAATTVAAHALAPDANARNAQTTAAAATPRARPDNLATRPSPAATAATASDTREEVATRVAELAAATAATASPAALASPVHATLPASGTATQAGVETVATTAVTATRAEALGEAEMPDVQDAVVHVPGQASDADDASGTASTDELPDIARTERARDRSQALLQYLVRATPRPPPIWHSGEVLDKAQQVQESLNAGRARRQPRIVAERERWHMEVDRAEVSVPVEASNPRLGTLTVSFQLLWQNDDWWVEQIALGPSS